MDRGGKVKTVTLIFLIAASLWANTATYRLIDTTPPLPLVSGDVVYSVTASGSDELTAIETGVAFVNYTTKIGGSCNYAVSGNLINIGCVTTGSTAFWAWLINNGYTITKL